VVVHPPDDLLPLPGIQPALDDLLATEVDLPVQHAGVEHNRSIAVLVLDPVAAFDVHRALVVTGRHRRHLAASKSP
jgi:hypothetical protein